MKENDFIGQMVQDTIHSSDNNTNLYNFDDSEVDRIIHFDFDFKRQCHCLTHKKQTLEIPRNWGPFKNRISPSIVISSSDDKYLFLDILNSFLGCELTSVRIVMSSDSNIFDLSKAA